MRHYPPAMVLPVTPEEMSAPAPAGRRGVSRQPSRLGDAGAFLVVLALVAIGFVLPFCG